jgi:hypothetical protein
MIIVKCGTCGNGFRRATQPFDKPSSGTVILDSLSDTVVCICDKCLEEFKSEFFCHDTVTLLAAAAFNVRPEVVTDEQRKSVRSGTVAVGVVHE